MHFSRPSGHRLSWWWPWYRGAVGRFSSGYMTVSTFLNISVKVTPNPLTGLKKLLTAVTGPVLVWSVSGTGDLLLRCVSQTPGVKCGPGLRSDAVVVRQVHRRHREPGRVPGLF